MQRGAELAGQSVEKAGATETSLSETSASVMRINDMAAQIAEDLAEDTRLIIAEGMREKLRDKFFADE